MAASRGSILPMAANENWFNAHNFYGDLAHLDAATLDDVRAFFKTYYAPNNAALVVTGDFSPADVKAWIQKYFGDLPSAKLPAAPDLKEPRQEKEKRAAGRIRWQIGRRSALAITRRIDSRQSGMPSVCSTKRSRKDPTRCCMTSWCGRRGSPEA